MFSFQLYIPRAAGSAQCAFGLPGADLYKYMFRTGGAPSGTCRFMQERKFFMVFYTKPLGREKLAEDVLKADRAHCRKYGPCGVGEQALYLSSFYLDRRYYVPFSCVERVFKRVAMSRGGFTGKGMFASLPYLVVVCRDGSEKQCLFKREEQVDELLSDIRKHYPDIRLQSLAVEERLRRRAEEEAARVRPKISEKAESQIRGLLKAREYLEERPALYEALSRSARAKRVNERSNPAYRWAALAIVLLGILASLYGLWAVVTRAGYGIYFTLFGLAAVFLFAGANVLPTGKNNRAYVDRRWREACEAMEHHLHGYSGFPLPARYAHPVVLTRMIRAIEDARAVTAEEAFEVIKEDLKRLNASVQVDQEEYDEIMAVKPMFLVEGYR